MTKKRDKGIVAEPASSAYVVNAQDKELAEGLSKIEQIYILRDPVLVKEFISNNRSLIDVLIEAYPHIEEHFGASPEVALEMFIEDEVDDNSAELFACIRTKLSVKEALDRLNAFEGAWFISKIRGGITELNFDVEFA